MKNDMEVELAGRRVALIAQSAQQRAELAQQAAALKVAAHVLDKINDGIQHIKKHPEILLLPLAITVVARPQRLLALGMSAFGLWRLLQSLRRLRPT